MHLKDYIRGRQQHDSRREYLDDHLNSLRSNLAELLKSQQEMRTEMRRERRPSVFSIYFAVILLCLASFPISYFTVQTISIASNAALSSSLQGQADELQIEAEQQSQPLEQLSRESAAQIRLVTGNPNRLQSYLDDAVTASSLLKESQEASSQAFRLESGNIGPQIWYQIGLTISSSFFGGALAWLISLLGLIRRKPRAGEQL